MSEFSVGDRVRVQAMVHTLYEAGRTGTVSWVTRCSDGAASFYGVRLDHDHARGRTAVYATYRPLELEPEASGTP